MTFVGVYAVITKTIICHKGPFIFYEIGGGASVRGGGGVTQKITVKYCKNSIYDDAKFSTKMP